MKIIKITLFMIPLLAIIYVLTYFISMTLIKSDPTFDIFIDRFQAISKKYKVKTSPVKISFTTDILHPAECRRFSNVIFVNKKWWDNLSPLDLISKEFVLFHELAHCSLNQTSHRNEVFLEYKLSILNKNYKYPIDTYYYSKYRKEYLEELFTKDPSSLINKIKADIP